MGSPVDSLTQLEQIIHRHPQHVTWSEVKQTTLKKGQAGLGIKIHTIQGQEESSTLVTKVKDECIIQKGKLQRFDRIIAINSVDITHASEETVFRYLKSIDLSEIVLSVCSPSWSIPRLVSSASPSPSLSRESRGVASLSLTKSANKSEFLELVEFNRNDNESYSKLDANQNEVLRHECSGSHNQADSNAACDENVRCSVHSDLIKTILKDRRKGKVLEKYDDVSSSSPTIKRGISQVSGNSSNKSMSGSCSVMFPNRRTERKSKGEGKLGKKFIKTSSTESPDQEDMEPLRLSDFNTEAKGHPYHPSLSGPVKDGAVSVADIVIDHDHAHSQTVDDLRPSPSQSQLTNCQCATCQSDPTMCVHCGVKPSPGGGRKTQSLPEVSFKDVPSGQMPEEYRTFLLKKPHLAVWDGKNTHVVEIDKGSAREFGFSYKIKVGKNQDTSVEIYTLVESVVKGGPAKGKLYVGDWIRSINGTPIQNPADALQLINNSSKERLLRLVIQRPVGLSQQPSRLQTDKLEKFSDIKPPSPQPQSLSPVARDNDPLLPSTPIPGIIEPKSEPQTKITPQNIYFQNTPPNSMENLDSSSPPFPKAVKLPKVRIFICGGEAEKCARFMLRDSDIALNFKYSGYACADCSMATDCFGNVVMSVPCSNLYSTSSQTGSYISETCKSVGDSRCQHCGSGSLSDRAPVALGTVVNVELFVVPDDRLFHHCCNYLFTKSSIFILTFDGAKLLGTTAGEFARLQNLSHTIRSFVGDEAHIMSCGLLNQPADQKNFIDEVRALFYTPYNTQLQNFNVCGPELINLCKSVSSKESYNENQQLQVTLWKVITDTIQRQRVLHPLLLIIDNLNGFRKKDVLVTEAKLMEMIRQKLPNFQQDVHQMVLTDLIMNGEILLGKALPFIMPDHRSIESLILLDPHLLMDQLHHAISIISEDKQIWNRTHSTGFMKATMLSDLLPKTGSHKQYVMSFIECCGLVFKKGIKQGEASGQDLFLPYFALLPSSTVSPMLDKKDLVLYLRFSEHEGSQVYWQLVLSLADQSDTPGSLAMVDVYTCNFMYAGLLVTTSHQKVDDQVKFVFKRKDKSSVLRAPELLEWMWLACHRALDPVDIAFHLGAPCPYGDECRRGQAQGLHLVDVRASKGQQFCGDDRIDHIKAIRVWRTKDTDSVNLPPVRSPNGPSSCLTPVKSPTSQKQPVKVMEIGWSVFFKICQKLLVHSPLGRDWRGLAGLMDYNMEEVNLYETSSNPPKQLLCDWSCTNNATIEDLVALLLELDRKDIVSDIRQHYPSPTSNNYAENNVKSSPSSSQQNKVLEEVELEHAPNVGHTNQDNKILNTQGVQSVTHGPGIQGVTITNVVSTNIQYSEEDNIVRGLGQSPIHNSQDQNTQMDLLAMGTVDTITPVEIIYQKSNSIPES